MIPFWVGVDYGSKLAGTTAITYHTGTQLVFRQSVKGQDADKFLLDNLAALHISLVVIDAPLSLPGVYSNLSGCTDYFYRAADRQCRAMSPMFIGGLTARAMKIRHTLEKQGLTVTEGYPKAFVQSSQLTDQYQKRNLSTLQDFVTALLARYPIELAERPCNWHQADSLITWLIGQKIAEGTATSIGKPAEGLICY